MKYELKYQIEYTEVFEAPDIKLAEFVALERVKRVKGRVLSIIPMHLATQETNSAVRKPTGA